MFKELRLIYLENIFYFLLISYYDWRFNKVKLFFNYNLELVILKYDLLLYYNILGVIF